MATCGKSRVRVPMKGKIINSIVNSLEANVIKKIL